MSVTPCYKRRFGYDVGTRNNILEPFCKRMSCRRCRRYRKAGCPGNWQGVFVPAQTPRLAVSRLNQELVRTLKSAEVTDKVQRVGGEVLASTPDEFSAVVRADLKKYAVLVKAVGIRAD